MFLPLRVNQIFYAAREIGRLGGAWAECCIVEACHEVVLRMLTRNGLERGRQDHLVSDIGRLGFGICSAASMKLFPRDPSESPMGASSVAHGDLLSRTSHGVTSLSSFSV
jgi:hypothetical protein